MSRLVLIDAHSIIHRAYHAVPPLTTSSGELVNAVYGFISTLFKVFGELKPEYVAVAFDRPEPTFRHEAYKDYKATRKETDKALSGQFQKTQEFLEAFNIPLFEIEGFEADDILGTLSNKAIKRLSDKVDEVVIVTGDKDALQLVSDCVKVYMPARTMSDTVLYDKARVENRFGLEPQLLIDFKALAGDASDNIPGVAGVGEVTAAKLLQEFGTLEKIYKNLDKIPEKVRSKLETSRDAAYLSKKLVTILRNIPLKFKLEDCRLKNYDQERVLNLLEEFEFKSLISRLSALSTQLTALSRKSESKLKSESRLPQADNDLDQKLEPVLKKMQGTGVLIDKKVLEKTGKKINSLILELERKIYREIGHECNLNSPKQLSQVLYGEIHLAPVKKTKTGLSTDEATLRALIGAHPIIKLLLEYRELFKLKSTYIDALPKSIDPKDGRIHSTFRLDVTATGRLSSQNPNLQNIPIRGEWGKVVRAAFVAPKGYLLLSADYSQIELRVMAHIANDSGLKQAFEKGLDIHAATAAKILGKPLKKVTEDDRRMAKTINFGLMYGMSAHGVARQLGIDYSRAAELIEDYFTQFPRVADYIQTTIRQAQEDGYVSTILGRRRKIPELFASNARIRAAGERMAVNYPIQGTGAEIIKKAMINIDEEFKIQMSKCKMVLQIHDELLFECPKKEMKKMARLVKKKMENAIKLSVPVVVDLKAGKNWGEMKSIL